MTSYKKQGFRAKRDANEKEIVSALEGEGYNVERLDKPLDLLVWKDGGPFYLVEVKAPQTGRLTKDQQDFMQRAPKNYVFIATSARGAIKGIENGQ